MKLDLGCGTHKREGFFGVDVIAFDGVDIVCDLRSKTWSVKREDDLKNKSVNLWATNNGDEVGEAYLFSDNSVSEVHSSHFVEHLTQLERVQFWNELYRVLQPKATALIVTPHWSHACAYGDPTHQWPPMSEWAAYYLNKAWREANAPHANDILTCDFDFTVGGSWDGWLSTRTPQVTEFAMQHYLNSWRDLHITLTKRG